MKEVAENLFVGNMYDYENFVKNQVGWSIVHACKEPYHRQLLGYRTKGAPKEHPEYFFAERGDRLYLNIVDAPDPAYIPKVIIDKAIEFIDNKLKLGNKVLIHCNEGMSRSPIIALLYLATTGKYNGKNFEIAEKEFNEIYPSYNPKTGTRGYAIINWNKYCI